MKPFGFAASLSMILTVSISSMPAHTANKGRAPHVARRFHIAAAGSVRALAMSGSIVVWVVGRGDRSSRIPRGDILGKNLATGRNLVVTTGGTVVSSVSMSGSIVVWMDCRFCRVASGLPGYANAVVYARNLASGRAFRVSGAGAKPTDPVVSGTTVAWVDRGTIFTRDITTRHLAEVSDHGGQQGAPAISGRTMVWQEMYNGTWGIYGKDLRSESVFRVAVPATIGDNLRAPMISGRTVVWTDWRPDRSVSIDGKDLATGRRFHVATIQAGTYNPQFGPAKSISGHIVAWEGPSAVPEGVPSYAVDGTDLLTGSRFQVSRGGQIPAVSGNIVVWLTPRGAASSIDGAVLD